MADATSERIFQGLLRWHTRRPGRDPYRALLLGFLETARADKTTLGSESL